MSGLSYFSNGGDTDAQVEQTAPVGVSVKASASKGPYAFPSPTGNVDMSPGVLDAMEQLYRKKLEEQNNYVSYLRDASAWFSPEPLAKFKRAEERRTEEADLFNIQTQLAQYKAAQEKAAREGKLLRGQLGIDGAGAGAPATAGGPGASAMEADVRQEIIDRLNVGDTAGAKALRDKWFTGRMTERTKKQQHIDYNVPKIPVRKQDPETGDYYVDTISAAEFDRNEMLYRNDPRAISARQKIQTPPPEPAQPTTQVAPASAAAPQAAAPGRVTTADIATVESGNRPGLVSSKGAMGIMQVLPTTAAAPGFGVVPAKDKSEAELKRVGEDYFKAMQEKYKGNDIIAAIAYNMGPGATDKWLAEGGGWDKLPEETRGYVTKIANLMASRGETPAGELPGGAPAQLAAAPSATVTDVTAPTTGARPAARPGRPPTVQELTDLQKARAEGLAEEFKGTGKATAMSKDAFVDSGRSAVPRMASLDNIEALINSAKKSVGVLAKPGLVPSVLSLAQEGISLGNFGTVGLKRISDFVRANGGDQNDIDAATQIAQEFSKLQLVNSRSYLKGQGAVSDAERRLLADLSGNIEMSEGAIKRFLGWNRMLADYDRKLFEYYENEWMPKNRGSSFENFMYTDKAIAMRKEYEQKLLDYAKNVPGVKSGKTTTGVRFKIVGQ